MAAKKKKENSTNNKEIIDVEINKESKKEETKNDTNNNTKKLKVAKPKKEKDKKDKKPNKFLLTLKDLGLSLFKTENLFKFGHKSCATPILILLVIILYIVLSPYMFINELSGEQIITQSNILYSDEAMAHILEQNLPCSIKNGKLACETFTDTDGKVKEKTFNETYKFDHTFENGHVKKVTYDLYVNFESLTEFRNDAETEYFKVELVDKPGDNYVVFQKDSVQIRYVDRSSADNTPVIFRIILLYKDLNVDFQEIYQNSLIKNDKGETDIKAQQNYLIDQSHKIVQVGYTSVLNQGVLVQSVYNITSLLLLFLIASLLLKGTYLFKKNEGFKYSQCLKISIVASLQAFLIGVIFSIARFDIMKVFGLLFTIRMIYLWARYTASSKNKEWFKSIYEETKDPRFNPNKLESK